MQIKKKSRLLLTLHCWIALPFGLVFVILGLSGSAIAWLHEFDVMLNPDLLRVLASDSKTIHVEHSTPVLIQRAYEKLAADARYGKPNQIVFPHTADSVLIASYRQNPDADRTKFSSFFSAPVSRQVMLDPATLNIMGERNWGELGLSRRLLMPTIFLLHRTLVAGEVGKYVIGISGGMLVLLVLSGIALWWPRPTRKAIWQALTISHGGSWPRFNFRLHRTVGFFVAPVLLVLGFSGLYFNLPHWVVPAVGMFTSVTPSEKANMRSLAPSLGAGQAKRSEQIAPMTALQIAQTQFPTARISRLSFPSKATASYEVRLRQPDEIRQGDGATRVTINAVDGTIIRVRDPMRALPGDRFLGWMFPLHSGEAFGDIGRILITCFGLMPLLFFITGLLIWLKRR